MWEVAFEPSMIGSPIVIHCPDGSNVQDLMAILKENGVKWCTGELPQMGTDCWGVEKENTVYYIEERKVMTYGDKRISCNDSYTRCTFYGMDAPDFDTATDDELLDFLGIGGV